MVNTHAVNERFARAAVSAEFREGVRTYHKLAHGLVGLVVPQVDAEGVGILLLNIEAGFLQAYH